ncbi:MAG: L,D-transpeptidase family protein [Phycisphaerales bacterium]
MALPSQASRAETWRSSGSAGGPSLGSISTMVGRNKSLFAGGLILAVAVGGWFAFKPKQAAADPEGPKSSDLFLPGKTSAAAPVGGTAAATPTPATQPAAETKPTTISMRSLNDTGAGSGAAAAKPAGGTGGTTLDDLIAQSGTKPQTQAPASTPVPGGQPGGGGGGGAAPTADPLNSPSTPHATPTGAPEMGTGAGAEVRALMERANGLVQQGQPVEARKILNDALLSTATPGDAQSAIKAQMATINETLFFGPTAFKNDPLTDEHAVASGETLGKIVRKEGLPIDWRLLVRINKMPTENSLRVGQKLKVIRQPLHAVVHKNAYRMDIFAGPPGASGSTGPEGQEQGWTYIRSFPVGLGESNGTPEGSFVVRANSKLVNPKWVNPRTGEVFQPDDPKNPIGERWIGLEGVDENTKRFAGYGVHGTVDPDSIGQQKSMGCVRMGAADIEVVYELLMERVSTVKILP